MKFKGIKIRKSANGVSWFARFRKNGKQYFISDKTQLGCYNKVKELITNFEKYSQIQTITLREWYYKWLEMYKSDVRQSTIADYKASFGHLKSILDEPIAKLTPIVLNEHFKTIPFERRRQKVYEMLNDVFKRAVANDIIKKNPLDAVLKPKHQKKSGESLSEIDEKILESYFKQHELDMFLICLYQGLRKSEMLALEITDVDFENKNLTINKSLDVYNRIGETKNNSSIRVIPLFDRSIEILKKYQGTEGRIFNFTQKQCQSAFVKAMSDCKFETKYTIHSLRHTFVTRCQEANVPIHIIQKWVGHVLGSKVTQDVYTHTRTGAELLYYNIINK